MPSDDGWGGIVTAAQRLRTAGWAPRELAVCTATTGDVLPAAGLRTDQRLSYACTGRAWEDPGLAARIAVSEALERYAACVYDERSFVVDTARNLGDEGVDLATVARCSQRELRHPSCPVIEPDPGAAIRWVPGTDLVHRRPRLVPVIMTYLLVGPRGGEGFWMPITTGCATHTTVEAALVGAICEIVERDALSLTWLQRLPLPRISPDVLTGTGRRLLEWNRRRGIETHLFDATTDLGVPTVYCLQTSDDEGSMAQTVGCATDFDAGTAMTKAMMECTTTRSALLDVATLPRRYADYGEPTDGAARMGRRSVRHAFSFLLDRPAGEETPGPASLPETAPPDVLARLLAILDRHEMAVLGVDLTLPELAEIGIRCVRVVIPELQPMSLRPLAQYRAHARLYTAPERMGHRTLPESRLNPWPQPMA